MHVRCPHCHNPIEVVDDVTMSECNCPSCGKSFSLPWVLGQMDLRLFSMNLHGYHPTGEAQRRYQNREGYSWPAPTHLHYFSTEELDRGHRRRLDLLADFLVDQSPDVIALQEVAAGCPWGMRNDFVFHHGFEPHQFDWFERNSALRLMDRLNARLKARHGPFSAYYTAFLGCRGTVGWSTSPEQFNDLRIVRFHGGMTEVVHDFGANPYPSGILVEGFAFLVRDWIVPLKHAYMDVPYNDFGHKVGAEFLAFRRPGEWGDSWPHIVVANVHLGHKVAHFEQCLAIRRALADFEASLRTTEPEGKLHPTDIGHCGGYVVAGDFNASLYRPSLSYGEVSTIPWEIAHNGEFDFRKPEPQSISTLKQQLHVLNDDDRYKPWATIRDRDQGTARINSAVRRFEELMVSDSHIGPMVDSFSESSDPNVSLASNRPATKEARIDAVLVSRGLEVEQSRLFFRENDSSSMLGLSDHPAIQVDLKVPW